jgi:hypothetical protein
MSYRDDAREIHKEARWTLWKFLPMFLGVIVLLTLLGFGFRSMGLWGGTVVERKVFEASYQRSEAIKSQIATDEAVLAEIQVQLSNPNLDPSTKTNLQAQAAAARVRIAATKGKMQ